MQPPERTNPVAAGGRHRVSELIIAGQLDGSNNKTAFVISQPATDCSDLDPRQIPIICKHWFGVHTTEGSSVCRSQQRTALAGAPMGEAA